MARCIPDRQFARLTKSRAQALNEAKAQISPHHVEYPHPRRVTARRRADTPANICVSKDHQRAGGMGAPLECRADVFPRAA